MKTNDKGVKLVIRCDFLKNIMTDSLHKEDD